ncbi:hypothetical protein IFT92_15370 [Peribacillus simplex]|uniref:hypothetical protein n=1 Tax=Peribacillus simplex TaxID=1478 RepID=UPI00192473A4|nr:hypothetical protein [Peribacillus simplex]MBD8589180.1 hypothetical protein [Peribacillus simplex]
MRIKEDLIVTSISLEGNEVPVPKGLSELLNRAGAWKYKAPGSLDNEMNPLENYERKVVQENGNFRTYLTYKKPLKKFEENKKVS